MNSSAQKLLLDTAGTGAGRAGARRDRRRSSPALTEAGLASGIVQYGKRGDLLTLAVKISRDRTGSCHHLRGHHPPAARSAPGRVVRRRAADRARDQEPADPDPARHRAAQPPLSQADRDRPRAVRGTDQHDHPPGRRTAEDGRRVLLLRAAAQAGVPQRGPGRVSPARRCSSRKSRGPDIDFSFAAEGEIGTIACDRHQFGQAMTNVLKNAVEAIEARAKDAGADYRGRIAVAHARRRASCADRHDHRQRHRPAAATASGSSSPM